MVFFSVSFGLVAVIGYTTFAWYPVWRFVGSRLGFYTAYNGRKIPLTGLQYILATGQGFMWGAVFSALYYIANL